MPSRRSVASQPEFFFDRSLGRETARRLRDLGWIVHLVSDAYPNDAQEIADEVWLRDGCARGWALLSKDKRIRYRGRELAALTGGRLFCLSNGNLPIATMVSRFERHRTAIWHHADGQSQGFWTVYEHEVRRQWP